MPKIDNSVDAPGDNPLGFAKGCLFAAPIGLAMWCVIALCLGAIL